MAIKVTCTRCKAPYTLADNKVGKTVRCRECGNTFAVEEEHAHPRETYRPAEDSPRHRFGPEPERERFREDDRPRRRRRDDDDDDWPRASSGSGTGLLIGLLVGGGLLLLLLVGGAVVGMIVYFSASVPPPPAPLSAPPVVVAPPAGFNMPGMPPAGADWNKLQIGWTEQQVIAMFGPPSSSLDYEGIHVIHANVTQDEVRGPDGRTRPVRKLTYFKGMGEVGFVFVTLVDGKVYKVKKSR
jgi:predicted Zn finger-like uncharacterized protein